MNVPIGLGDTDNTKLGQYVLRNLTSFIPGACTFCIKC